MNSHYHRHPAFIDAHEGLLQFFYFIVKLNSEAGLVYLSMGRTFSVRRGEDGGHFLEIQSCSEVLAVGLEDDCADIGKSVNVFEGVSNFVEEGHVHGVEVFGAGDGNPNDLAFFELFKLEYLQ